MRWNPRRLLPGTRLPDRREGPVGALVGVFARAGRPAATAVETAGFWAAVLLPLCYLPLLVDGLRTGEDAVLLLLLVVLHLVALTAGHAHNRD